MDSLPSLDSMDMGLAEGEDTFMDKVETRLRDRFGYMKPGLALMFFAFDFLV
jgi:hypothetical protein